MKESKESKEKVVFDVECYSNYFLVLFKRLSDGRIFKFELTPKQRLDTEGLESVLKEYTLIGFNSNDYDLPIIRLALKGATNIELKRATDDIIGKFRTSQEVLKNNKLYKHNYDHIDIINVAPLKASLKIYAGRLHAPKMSDLPYNPASKLKPDEIEKLVEYCKNDLDNTRLLYEELYEQMSLREKMSEQYGQDFRSRSDAQIAERVIAHGVQQLTGKKIEVPQIPLGTKFKYQMPSYINYSDAGLRKLKSIIENTEFEVVKNNRDSSKPERESIGLPGELDGFTTKLFGKKYAIGIGGLHSCETQVAFVSDEERVLIDRDVASYYPSIIIQSGLYPTHIGESFQTVYRDMVKKRLDAKKNVKELKEKLSNLNKQLEELNASN